MDHSSTLTAWRKRAVVMTVSAVASLALVGCSSTPPTQVAKSVDDTPAVGKVDIWAPSGDAAELENLLADFQADNPELEIALTVIPTQEFGTKVQTAIASGTEPDMALIPIEAQWPYLATGAFAEVPEGLVDPASFFPGTWDAGIVDGAAHSVPWYAFTRVMLYRADLASAAGVEPPETWDDLRPFLDALQGQGAEHGIALDVGWNALNGQAVALFMLQAGAEILDAEGNWHLDSPEAIEAAEFYTSLYLDGYAATDSPVFLDQQPYLAQGRIGSLITGPWVIGQLDESAGEEGWTAEHIGTAPIPAGPAGSMGQVAGGSWTVFDSSESAEAAWKIIRELSKVETQLRQYSAYGSLPAVAAAWDDPAIADQPLLSAFLTQLGTSVALPQTETAGEVYLLLGQQMEPVARGITSAADALATLQNQVDALG